MTRANNSGSAAENAYRTNVEWLTLLLAVVTLATMVAAYVIIEEFASPTNAWVRLALNLLPNLIAVLIVTLVVYWALSRKAIPSLVEVVRKNTDVGVIGSSLGKKGIKDFYEKFGQTPWSELLRNAASIDIATWYFDSWIRNHRDEIRDFFGRGGRIQLILPDPRDNAILSLTQERYPELDADDARKKIANTGMKLISLAVESGSKLARVDVILCTRVLSYSSLRFDGSIVVLSVFDQFRSGQVGSPALLLDLNRSPSLRTYWDKEIGGFFEVGQHVDMETLRSIYTQS